MQGLETARCLYERGAHVVMACRDEGKARTAMGDIEASAPSSSGVLEFLQMDLSEPDSGERGRGRLADAAARQSRTVLAD